VRILFENEEPRADDAAGSDIAKQVNNDLSNRYLCHQPTTVRNHRSLRSLLSKGAGSRLRARRLSGLAVREHS
jgi:hypothetical protein